MSSRILGPDDSRIRLNVDPKINPKVKFQVQSPSDRVLSQSPDLPSIKTPQARDRRQGKDGGGIGRSLAQRRDHVEIDAEDKRQ